MRVAKGSMELGWPCLRSAELSSNFGARKRTPGFSGVGMASERGIDNRLAADGRFSVKQILSGVRWRFDSLISGGGYPANQLVLGPNPAGLFRWDD